MLEGPLRRAAAQMAEQLSEAVRGQRRVLPHDHVDQRVDTGGVPGGRCRAGQGLIARGAVVPARGVHAGPAVAPRDPQQPAIVHLVEQAGGRVGGAAEPVGHLAVCEMRIHGARMRGAAVADELKHRVRPAGRRAASHAVGGVRGCISR